MAAEFGLEDLETHAQMRDEEKHERQGGRGLWERRGRRDDLVLKQPLLGSRGRGDGCALMVLRQPLLARRGRRDTAETV